MHSVLITGTVVVVTFATVLALETLFPLRRTVEPKLRRVGRNLIVAGTAAAVAELLRIPLLMPVVVWAGERQLGLLNLVELSAPWRLVLALLLLDYTLWWWHWLSHQVPFLWRFHLVHHVDRDLDASTALRFHFGEHALSVFFRSAQVILIGASPLDLFVFQTVLFASVLFHHGNVRLPARLEAVVVRLIVTPRMHGIHHSDHREEANSNWSSILSVWDRLHRTLILGIPQRDVVIGVPAYASPEDVSIGRILRLPFVRQRDDWQGRIGPRAPRGSGFEE